MLRNLTYMRAKSPFPGVPDFSHLEHAPTSAGFDMSNSLHVHIGDQLFIEPILREFRDRGVKVVVAPTPSMRGYFKLAGYTVVTPEEVLKQELRVAHTWMYDFIPRSERRRRFIYVNTTDHNIRQPISNHLAERVLALAKLGQIGEEIDGRPFLPEPVGTVIDGRPGKWIVFNDAVDSGAFRITQDHVDRLWQNAAAKHAEGYSIIRVGSQGEKDKSPQPLPFEHLDVRGSTDVVGLFRILGRPEVVGTLSFDTAVAHIGLAYHKPAMISMRRFTPAHTKFVKRYVIPSYATRVPVGITYL